jgi:hypothetical protein
MTRGLVRVGGSLALACALFGLLGSANPLSAKPKPAAFKQILVNCSPNPAVEVAASSVILQCQVEALASAAGKTVTISAGQLRGHCASVIFHTLVSGDVKGAITLPLDNDGNAVVSVSAFGCAPGSALVSADLNAPPFATAVSKLILEAPQVTPAGVKVFANPEIEVGDVAHTPIISAKTASEVDLSIYVETSPVYAEQSVSVTSNQLTERCGQGSLFEGDTNTTVLAATAGPAGGIVATQALDNAGNAAFLFQGGSCAAGKSTVIAEVGGGGPTYSTRATILPPSVTI